MLDPVLIQRIEGAALLLAAFFAFDASGWSWWWFAGLLLVPDLSMLGYLAGSRVGAVSYNLVHMLVGPAALLGWWWADGAGALLALGSVWLAHIGMDRTSGYGLKLADGFKHTHLGQIGKMKRPAESA